MTRSRWQLVLGLGLLLLAGVFVAFASSGGNGTTKIITSSTTVMTVGTHEVTVVQNKVSRKFIPGPLRVTTQVLAGGITTVKGPTKFIPGATKTKTVKNTTTVIHTVTSTHVQTVTTGGSVRTVTQTVTHTVNVPSPPVTVVSPPVTVTVNNNGGGPSCPKPPNNPNC